MPKLKWDILGDFQTMCWRRHVKYSNDSNFLFLISASSSKVGGLLAITCFFYNHEECTRVMWTPPLRESFGYPLSLLQIALVSWTLNSRNSSNNLQKSISIAILTTLYLLSWQFAQFTLFSQVCIIFVLNVLGFLEQPSNVKTVFYSLMVSYGC